MTSDWLKCSADLPGTPLCNLPVGTGHLFFLNQVSEMLFLSLAVEELRKLPSRRLVGTSRVVVKELLELPFSSPDLFHTLSILSYFSSRALLLWILQQLEEGCSEEKQGIRTHRSSSSGLWSTTGAGISQTVPSAPTQLREYKIFWIGDNREVNFLIVLE